LALAHDLNRDLQDLPGKRSICTFWLSHHLTTSIEKMAAETVNIVVETWRSADALRLRFC
jgi:hypothetical protein